MSTFFPLKRRWANAYAASVPTHRLRSVTETAIIKLFFNAIRNTYAGSLDVSLIKICRNRSKNTSLGISLRGFAVRSTGRIILVRNIQITGARTHMASKRPRNISSAMIRFFLAESLDCTEFFFIADPPASSV
jgi:hypothetical protein